MKNQKLVSVLFVAALAGASVTGAVAQTSAVGGKDVMASKSLSDEDREFMIKAAGGGLFEIEASKMAAVKSQNADVKRYAAMLVKDHTAASETLKTIAVAKPLRLPLDMPDGKKADLNMLSKSTPAEFDEKYIKIVGLDDHKADIKLFEAAVAKGKDPQVKDFAAKTLPKLRAHLAAAEKLAAASGASAGTK
ncbi:DUF4142 domain-containing protein [Variovorax sp. RHLX14]|uniref:DUF4142 domain-containing protein n=1 Tax=Variovorax sp. RHLX14 TaxID=1259731 RepID=UPI003F4794C4